MRLSARRCRSAAVCSYWAEVQAKSWEAVCLDEIVPELPKFRNTAVDFLIAWLRRKSAAAPAGVTQLQLPGRVYTESLWVRWHASVETWLECWPVRFTLSGMPSTSQAANINPPLTVWGAMATLQYVWGLR